MRCRVSVGVCLVFASVGCGGAVSTPVEPLRVEPNLAPMEVMPVAHRADGLRVAARRVELAVGSTVACVRAGRDVYCWGDNHHDPSSSELCRWQWNDIDYRCHRTPTRVLARDGEQNEPLGFVNVVAGVETVCGILESGQVACWGTHLNGGRANVASDTTLAPIFVAGLEDVVGIAVGSSHRCGLVSDGSVHCWGRNADGQVGDGTRSDRATPTRVRGLPPVVEIVSGGGHTCARTEGGALWCWGDGGYGALGNEEPHDQLTPTAVEGLPPMASLYADHQETCGLTPEGDVWCWGGGPVVSGERNAAMRGPRRLQHLSGIRDLAVGVSHACALHGEGTVSCWGDNMYGTLGDGTISSRFEPRPVAALGDVLEIDASWRTNCARTRKSEIYCWGVGDRAQLGGGTLHNRRVPTRVVLPLDVDVGDE